MNFQINVSDILALIAILIAAYSFKKTIDFNKKQNEFVETNDRLNKLLIEREKEELLTKNSADLTANFIKAGSGNYRLIVFNRGQSAAKDVRIEIMEGHDIFITGDINTKFPLEILERQQSVKLIAAVDNQSSNKAKIKLVWNDESGNDKFNIITPVV